MRVGDSLPNYQLLFGGMDFRPGDEARTVNSPAAYLADLLRLLDEEVDAGGARLHERRPDIREIPLDAAHTTTELPYIDIVVEILERLAGPDPYERMKTMPFPFDKPFNLAYEELGTFLKRHRVGREEVPRLFGAQAAELAAQFLGLSPEVVGMVTTARPREAELRASFQIGKDEQLGVLADAARLCRTAGLSEVELTQVLGAKFVGQGGSAVRSVDGRLNLPGGAELLAWLDRFNRFVRLARRTGLSFEDLDLVLSGCCENRLDAAALGVLAAAVHVSRSLGLPMDVTVSLAAPMPAELEVRTFAGVTVAEGLRIGAAELERLRARFGEVAPGETGLSALHRAARLMAALGLAADELFDLLRLLDGSIAVPFATRRTTSDCRRILAAPDAGSGLWLAQALPLVVRWMRDGGLSAQDLAEFAGGPRPGAEPGEPAEGEEEFAAALGQALAQVAPGPRMFVSDRFSERASRAIWDGLAEGEPYGALIGMAQITPSDFTGLGLGDRLAVKIFTNLVLRGNLTADGELVEVPSELATDFSPYRDKVAELFGDLGDMCYPSHLEELTGLSIAQRAELYDNLIYNDYIDAEGVVLNAAIGELNADLGDVADSVIELIRAGGDAYLKEPLKIELGAAPDGLLENLKYNGFIDGDGNYRDKEAVTELAAEDFALAAEFEPYKADILAIMQEQVAELWAQVCVFPPEAFVEIAELAVARRIIDAGGLDRYDPVVEERLRTIAEEQRPYRLDREALIALGLGDAGAQAVLDTLIQGGDLDKGLALPEDRLPFFAEPNSVVEFYLPAIADYSAQVFGLLNEIAVATQDGVEEIEAVLAAQEEAQAAALLAVAQDALGVPVPVVTAICAGVGAELTDLLEPPTTAYRRIRAFARLAAKLGMDERRVALAFGDLRLAARYPEPLALPAQADGIDAVLESADGDVYVFRGERYWRFHEGRPTGSAPLTALAAGLTRVDAAFRHPSGADWLVSGSRAYVREPGSTRWVAHEQIWGRFRDEFAGGGKITAALVDGDGRTYLFCGDQYVRYSTGNFSVVDEGFPRPAEEFGEPGFFGRDGEFHAFGDAAEFWRGPAADEEGPGFDGQGFDGLVDAAYADPTGVYVFRGDRVVLHTASLENEGAQADDGYPVKIETRFPGVPAEFERDIEAAFADAGRVVHLFKDGRTVALTGDARIVPTVQRWGNMPAAFPSGRVDAAFVGLDGRTYLFSGDTYLRYSGTDYSRVDLGYPRRIAPDWGGLTSVNAGFVLDGETYLFGGGRFVRYSTGDYTKPDEGYPQPLPGNWWNLPDTFGPEVDAVFTSAEGRTYLFRGDRYVEFDARRRWWSAPRKLAEQWDSVPFASVDAAFVGRDGRTYMFWDGQYVRYSNGDYSRADDSYPAPVAAFWGRTRNNLARTGRVDAALQLDGHTYLFSGDQFIRYTGTTPDLGYPRALADLKEEPRLGRLTVELDAVDAAFADRGNVYLFREHTCHVVSDALHRTYDVPDVSCAFVADGQLIVEGAGGWRRQGSVEGLGTVTGPARPRLLRELPERFRTGLDAVLYGTDGVTYVFKGDACYDTLVDREYPIAEAWGRPRRLGAVDAGFTGRDRRTYLFSGDQYTVDGGRPHDTAAAWGGLTSVAIAYVWQESTYLFEKPDEDGFMRYVVYSGDDYAAPDPGYPQVADASYWNADEVPRAVLPVGDTLVLLAGLTYTLPDGSAPRPIGRLWRGFEGTLTSAYVGGDGATYFCFGEQYRRYADGAFGPLTSPAGESFGRVDAAFTWAGRTYLISGDRYARYSTEEYAYADPGYPKPMSRNFRKEFPGLAESFEDALTAADARIDAAVTGRRSLYLFMGGRCHVVSAGQEAVLDTAFASGHEAGYEAEYEDLAGRTRPLGGPLDAALIVGERTYLLSGGRYSRYTGNEYTRPDEGYPRAIFTWLADDLGVPPLPEEFRDGVDAGFAGNGIHLFAGTSYLRADAPDTPRPAWGRVRNAFDRAVDAVVAIGDEIYAFRGDQYVRYTIEPDTPADDALPVVRAGVLDLADPGFPRTIKDDWGAVPTAFEAGVDAAFTLAGRLYLVRGGEYVSGAGLVRAIAEGFADTADHRLADLFTIIRFAALGPAPADALTAADEDPYKTMAALFGWDVAELMWAQRTMPSESNMSFVLAARELFALARKAGVPPSRLPGLTGERDSGLRRDALLSVVLAADPDLADSTDLFDRQLIDVDMGGQGVTSRIREAIAAVQLYLHRCQLDLEQAPGLADPKTRARLRRWWSWMKNYRVWEANRKVYLYPENYLRPELRDTKTPGYADLESDLLQSGVTSATAQRAYKRYLDEYTEVSRLEIAGGYVDAADAGARDLVLFGRTRSDPRRYYYRTATFRDGDKLSATWRPWQKVDVRIDADRVQPVRAFDRTFVFWATVEDLPPERTGTTSIAVVESGNTQQVTAPTRHAVKIYFSYVNLNQEWMPAQLLATGASTNNPILGVTLAVRPGSLAGGDHQAITVSYVATTTGGPMGTSYALTPELYTVPVPGIAVQPPTGDVTTIFDEPGEIDPASVIWFNRPAGFGIGEGSWFSVDHKGGSFLCRPIMPAEEEPAALAPIKGATGLPNWVRVDAAFTLPDGTRYFFNNNRGGRFTRMAPGSNTAESSKYISWHWGLTEPLRPSDPSRPSRVEPDPDPDAEPDIVASAAPSPSGQGGSRSDAPDRHGPPGHVPPGKPVSSDGPGWTSVNAAWVVDDTYLFITSGTQVARYTLGPGYSIPEVMDRGYPQTLTHTIDAVFRGYAISGTEYARVGEWSWRPLAGNWGELPAGVTGALETGTDVYFFIGDQYAVYAKGGAVPRPYEYTEVPHDIVRLTTSTAYKLNQRLLAGGVPALLDPYTQETDELPAFDTEKSDAVTIKVRKERVKAAWLPGRSHLDFTSANGIYYWEIFFHAPLLIAQALNAAQRFDEARTWYEYIFDPTQPGQPWRFLPFLGADPAALADALRAYGDPGLAGAIALLDSLVPVFRGGAALTDVQRKDLAALSALPSSEELAIAMELPRVYDVTGDVDSLREAYRDDPFDPHAIAALRPVAYRRAVVTGYIDNLLDWGDQLYRRYTPESVDEARMLYIFAYDLLGRRPQELGPMPLDATMSFAELEKVSAEDELFGELARVHASIGHPYFFAPVNAMLLGYWDLVADRLTKIRASLDIMGISRPLPLFEPPIDPMTLVAGAYAGELDGVSATPAAEVPQHRFAYLYRRAQELTDRVCQFGAGLLDVLERSDAEALSMLQSTQEAGILELTRAVKEAQIADAEETLAALQTGLAGARGRMTHFQQVIDAGVTPLQAAQLAMMAAASTAHLTSSGLRIGASIAHGAPQILIGPFILGTMEGGDEIGDALDSVAGVAESLGEGLSVLGELLGVRAEQERSMQDNQLQLAIATNEAAQIEHQVASAEARLAGARRELDILRRQIANQEAVTAFLREKFTGADLYQWMSGRLAGLYFQTYGMAADLARAAERAYQYERGATGSVITSAHWDSRRKGLLAGQLLAHDLDRLGQAYAAGEWRRLEITRQVSLLELDPVALLTLRTTGSCEFALTEDFFDRDFPGHYRRQIRTIAVAFVGADGATLPLNAMLGQVTHHTVLTPDPKGVQYLLAPTGTPPGSVRTDWRAGRQIALSQPPEGWENNGLFELRYDEDRYLPFEGTGAVSTWRLTLPGLRSADHPADLYDARITLRYEADHGGETFAAGVKGLLQPYDAARFIDVAVEFPEEWESFTDTLTIPLSAALLPDLYSPQITGIYMAYDLDTPGAAQFAVHGNPLVDGRLLPTPGLPATAPLALTFTGDRTTLRGLRLALLYRAR
ncbi:hemopexin repeat-containing protein [Nonomuraea sp. JJY05]|uniref:Tc toxin subunit A-related protein n=1 Tax=Nonomuraea sp. JJY05 TaxID=3350255 RepID=UPI00373E137C